MSDTEPTDAAETLEPKEDEMQITRSGRRKTQTHATSAAALSAANGKINRITGLTVDFDRLDDDQTERLTELTGKLTDDDDGLTHGGGWNFGRLSKKETRQWQDLVEAGSNKPGYFAMTVELRKQARHVADLAREQVRAPKRPAPMVAAGDLLLPGELFRQVAAHARKTGNPLTVADWGYAIVLLFALENSGEAVTELVLGPHARFHDRDTLAIDSSYGPLTASFDPRGSNDWKRSLARLETLRLLEVEKLGHEWRIRRGEFGKLICERKAA